MTKTLIATNPAIKTFKAEARAIQGAEGLTYSAALDRVAHANGHSEWKFLLKDLEKPAAPGHAWGPELDMLLDCIDASERDPERLAKMFDALRPNHSQIDMVAVVLAIAVIGYYFDRTPEGQKQAEASKISAYSKEWVLRAYVGGKSLSIALETIASAYADTQSWTDWAQYVLDDKIVRRAFEVSHNHHYMAPSLHSTTWLHAKKTWWPRDMSLEFRARIDSAKAIGQQVIGVAPSHGGACDARNDFDIKVMTAQKVERSDDSKPVFAKGSLVVIHNISSMPAWTLLHVAGRALFDKADDVLLDDDNFQIASLI